MTKILCVVPARSGSVRIPKKNLLELNGKSLVRLAYDAALESGVFEDIVISTDDAEMTDGLPWVHRPLEISKSTSDISDAVKHALMECELKNNCKYTHVVCLQPAIPLRTPEIIKSLVSNVIANNCNGGLTGVQVVPWLWREQNGFATNSWYPNAYPRSQEFVDQHLWQEVNSIQVCTRDLCMAGNRWGLPLYIQLLPTYAVLDIDEMDDYLRAKRVFTNLLTALESEGACQGFVVNSINGVSV